MEKNGIVKLTNENYDSWKLEVEFLLIREGLWKFICPGTRPEEAADGSNVTAVAAWDDGDQRARATVGLLLSRSQHSYIRNTRTAKEVWSNLAKQHEKKSLSSKVQLLKRICDLRYHDGDDIEAHLVEFENLFEKLANAGTKLDDDLQVVLVFRSLPSTFDALTTTLENRTDDELTLALVKDKIVNEVQKQKATVPADMAVLKVDGKQKQVIICHLCGNAGHKKRYCEKWRKVNQENSPRQPNTSSRSVARHQAKVRSAYSDEQFVFGTWEDSKVSWIVDSGASSHMCADRKNFISLDKPQSNTPRFVTVADGKKAQVKGIGSCRISCYGEDVTPKTIVLNNVLYIPDLDLNLVSVGKLVEKGATVTFNSKGCYVMSGNRIAAVATWKKGLYHLRVAESANLVQADCREKDCIHDWHRKLGHRDLQAVQEIESKKLATGITIRKCKAEISCEACLQGKFARLPFPKDSQRKSTAVLDLVHSDLCGPMRTVTPGGRLYFLTLIDDYSRYTTVYLLRRKSDTAEVIEDFVKRMKTQFGRPPKILRSDQGGEYQAAELVKYLKSEGVRQQFTASYSPQQNGVAERKNRSLMEMARCMLLEAKMDHRYWGEAVNTACFLQNMLPSKAVPKTPFEIWHGVKPDMEMMRVFGSRAYVFVPDAKRSKLEAKSVKLTFVGYSLQHKAWRFVDERTKKVTISRDARFLQADPEDNVNSKDEGSCDEGLFYLPTTVEQTQAPMLEQEEQHKVIRRNSNGENLSDDFEGYSDTSLCEDPISDIEVQTLQKECSIEEEPEKCPSEAEPLRRSQRSTKGIPPDRYGCCTLVQQKSDEPRTYQEAVASSEVELWRKAMQEELESMEENKVWELTKLPAGKKTIGCRWIFKKKVDENGAVIRHKARLVAQGFSQKYGVDYDEVFAPVVKQVTFRTLLSVAHQKKMLIKHADIKTAYLNGDLEETVYMRLPPGLSADPGLVCRLRKGLYGLKQAARIWNQKLDGVLKTMGFKPSTNDCCLYVKHFKGKIAYIALYVDDFVIACECEEDYKSIIEGLDRHFNVISLGDIKFFLGIQVNRGENHISLCQKGYIQKLLSRFGLEDAKGSKIPMDPGHLQAKEENVLPNNKLFASLIGGLLYVAVNTRPDIAAAVSILGRKTSCPTPSDWNEAKRILRYLKETIDHELVLGIDSTPLEVFVDADWAGDSKDRKSTTGYLFRFSGGMIAWCSRKQDCVTLSSSEAEYVAISDACKELNWILRLLGDFRVPIKLPVIVNEDNQSAIKQLESGASTKRSKHVDTRYHYARQLKEEGVISPSYLSTDAMVADMMTKPLQRVKLARFREAAKIYPSRRSIGSKEDDDSS